MAADARAREAARSGAESLADQVQVVDPEVVEFEVLPLQLLDVEAGEAAVVEKILAQGDVAGARKVLEDNASYIKRSYEQFGSGAAPAPAASISALNALEKQNREAANNLDAGSWNRTRKEMRCLL